MSETISRALRTNRTIKERLQMLTDTDEFRELIRHYVKYGKFGYYVIQESRAEVTCHKTSIKIRMIPKPFTHIYDVAEIVMHPHSEFDILMSDRNPTDDQHEIDLFMQDLKKILQ